MSSYEVDEMNKLLIRVGLLVRAIDGAQISDTILPLFNNILTRLEELERQVFLGGKQ